MGSWTLRRRRCGLMVLLLTGVFAWSAASAAAATVSGVLRDASGDPVAGVAIGLGSASGVTDLDGSYSLTVAPGSYTFSGAMSAGGASLGLPETWSLSGPLTVGGDRTFDPQLPAVSTLTVRALDGANGDAPLEGAGVELPGFQSVETILLDGQPGFRVSTPFTSSATDASGELGLALFDGTGARLGRPGTLTPPEETGYAPESFFVPTIDGDTTVTVRAPQKFVWVSGTIRDAAAAPLAGVTLESGASTFTTGLDGSYRLMVAPSGGVALSATMPDAASVGLPADWRLGGRFSAYADRTLDVTLPEAQSITVRVVGLADAPVPGSLLELPGYAYWFPLDSYGELTNFQLWSDPTTPTTDANGEASVVQFDGTQPRSGRQAVVRPPEDGGYSNETFSMPTAGVRSLVVVQVEDRTAPELALDQAPDGAHGWWAGRPATVHVTASDPQIASLSCTIDGASPRRLALTPGPGTLEGDLTVRGEGRHTVGCTAADASGNDEAADAAVLIDLHRPNAPSLAADRAPDYAGGGGWYADTVTVTTTDDGDPLLADGSAGSGVDPGSVPAPQTFTTSGRHVASASVADVAGNVSATARLSVKVDADAPASTLTCPAGSVRLGSRASARSRDHDDDSGLAGPGSGRQALDTSTAGAFTVEHTATDHVGHATTSSCSYTVTA